MENSKNFFYYSDKKPKKFLNYDLEKVYSKILGKDYISYKFNKIVLGTKRLVSNNHNYNDFSKEYDEKTKISTFKYPNLDIFPITKNFELIPLGKIKYSYDSTKGRIRSGLIPKFSKNYENNNQNNYNFLLNMNSKDNIRNQINIDSPKSINNDIAKNTIDNEYNISRSTKKIIAYKSLNSPVYKNFNSLNEKTPSSINNSNIRYISSYINRKIFSSSAKTNFSKGNIRKKLISGNIKLINYKKYIHNNRVLLRDSLLNEKEYLNLEYNEDKIFLQTEHYNNFINNHINFIKTNNLKFEFKGNLEKIYEKSKFYKPKLVLKPIIIEFKKIFSFQNNKNQNNLEQSQIFEIPFEYTPIFYKYNLTKIKEILTSVFYLNKDYTSFNINYENFAYLLNHYSSFNETKTSKDAFQRNSNKKTQTSKMGKFQSLSLNKALSSKINKRSSVSLQKDVPKIIDIFNNDYNFNIINKKGENFGEKNKTINTIISSNRQSNKIYFSNKTSFEYIWLTPKYEYLVNIKTPEIYFYINDITIYRNVNVELIFFFLENNFINWDFYAIEYLFSFCKFSLIINNFLSIYKINKYHFKSNFILKNKNINLSEEKKLKYSRKNYNLEYIFTDENLNNYIKVFRSYKILIYNKKLNQNYQFCFHINLTQMKSLYYSIKKQGVKYLIEKIFTIDKDTMKIKLNYDYLDNFCKSDLNNLENLISKNNKEDINIDIQDNKYSFYINENKICLYYPNLESLKFIKNLSKIQKDNCFELITGNESTDNKIDINILEKIMKTNDLYIWPNIIEFKNKIKEKSNKKFNDLYNGFKGDGKKIMKSVIIKKRNLFNEEN